MESINRSCVNRLRTMIPRRNLKFKFEGMSNFDYRTLMNDPTIKIDTDVTKKFASLNREFARQYRIGDMGSNIEYLSDHIRNEMLGTGYSEIEITDMLVKELFGVRRSTRKIIFWNCYGDIVLSNIQRNIDSKFAACNFCGGRFYKEHNTDMVCPNCKGKDLEKPKTKTLICVDCGTPFEVKSSDTRSVRCYECRSKYRREKISQNVRRFRDKCNH